MERASQIDGNVEYFQTITLCKGGHVKIIFMLKI